MGKEQIRQVSEERCENCFGIMHNHICLACIGRVTTDDNHKKLNWVSQRDEE